MQRQPLEATKTATQMSPTGHPRPPKGNPQATINDLVQWHVVGCKCCNLPVMPSIVVLPRRKDSPCTTGNQEKRIRAIFCLYKSRHELIFFFSKDLF